MPLTPRPVGFRVLVEELEERQYGNIIAPDGSDMKHFRHKVIMLGDPLTLDSGEVHPLPVKEGDEISFDTRYAHLVGPPAMFNGRKFAIVDVQGILAVYEGEMDPPTPGIVIPKPSQKVNANRILQ